MFRSSGRVSFAAGTSGNEKKPATSETNNGMLAVPGSGEQSSKNRLSSIKEPANTDENTTCVDQIEVSVGAASTDGQTGGTACLRSSKEGIDNPAMTGESGEGIEMKPVSNASFLAPFRFCFVVIWTTLRFHRGCSISSIGC